MTDAPAQKDGGSAVAGLARGDLERVVQDTVAVVGASGSQVAIWHVDVGPDTTLDRQCGAWVLDAASGAEGIRTLTRGRRAWATAAGARALADCGAEPAAELDAGATVQAVRDEISGLQELFEQELRASGRSLVGPAWPAVPDEPAGDAVPGDSARAGAPADPADPADPSASAASADDLAAAVLASGRWLAGLADVWQKVEGQRRQRDFLRVHGGAERRSLPVVLRG